MAIRQTKIRHAIGAASVRAQDFPFRSTREARWQRLPQVFFPSSEGWVGFLLSQSLTEKYTQKIIRNRIRLVAFRRPTASSRNHIRGGKVFVLFIFFLMDV